MTLEDQLKSQGQPANLLYACDGSACQRNRCKHAAFTLEVVTGDPDLADGTYCYSCKEAVKRVVRRDTERAHIKTLTGWARPEAQYVRDKRNQLLDQYAWTISPASPLTRQNQAEWTAYLKKLNRLTVDFTNPSQVAWPVQPSLNYE